MRLLMNTMALTVALILSCGTVFSSQSEKDKEFKFRNYGWNTTQDEILAAEGVYEIISSNNASSRYDVREAGQNDEIMGLPCSIEYIFDSKKKLCMIAVNFLNVVDGNVGKLKELYVNKYGKPAKTEGDKSEDAGKLNETKKGITTLYWDTGATEITLCIYTQESKIVKSNNYVQAVYKRKLTKEEKQKEEEEMSKAQDKI